MPSTVFVALSFSACPSFDPEYVTLVLSLCPDTKAVTFPEGR